MQPEHQHGLFIRTEHVFGQVALQPAPARLETQHWLLAAQLTGATAPAEQSTSHGPVPQSTPTSPQELPMHLTVQELLALQLTPLLQLGPIPPQVTSQVPLPHVTGPVQAAVMTTALQTIMQELAALQSTSPQPPLQVTLQGPAPQRTLPQSVQRIWQLVAAEQSSFPLQPPDGHWI